MEAELKPQKHAYFIKMWADGHIIQEKRYDSWCIVKNPSWDLDNEYRVKPERETIKIKVALFKRSMYCDIITYADSEERAVDLEKSKNFIQWLTDWMEVELVEAE